MHGTNCTPGGIEDQNRGGLTWVRVLEAGGEILPAVSKNIQQLRWRARFATGYKPEDVTIPKRFLEITTGKGTMDAAYLAAIKDQYAKAIASPRKRAHHNIHSALEDPVQRLCVAIEPGTYVRPHRHADPSTWEMFILLRGSAVLLLFDEQGRVNERTMLAAHGPVNAVEIPADAWHSLASLETGSVFFEVKQGPYKAPRAGNSAAWAPEEGTSECTAYEAWYRKAQVGELPPVPGQ